MKSEIPSEARIDAFTAEVIRSALIAITGEMKTNLMRTAYHTIIYEAEDFTVGLFDADGNTISIGLGLPMFIRGLSDAIRAKIAHWGKDNIHPGDILLTNDSYIMGSHLNHMIYTLPIFNDGELVAFSSSMAHWQDIGGQLGGITRDIFSEGLQLPFVKHFRAGVENSEITDIIKANVRVPSRAMGDLRAQLAAIRTGERRVMHLLKRYGNRAFKESIQIVFEQSEKLARAAVEKIPDGVYQAESFMDDDGVNIGKHIPIKVRIEVRGDQMTIDLSGVAPQVAGFYNSGPTAGRSAAELVFKCITTPLLLPINEGSFRPLKIILPPGRVVSAMKPAPVRVWHTVPMTVCDTLFKALADACPERTIAGHYADLCIVNPHGFDIETGKFFFAHIGHPGGGWGAKSDQDGMSATVALNDGDTHNSPIEATEAKSPIVIEQRALRQDSGGAGKFRGGLGVAQQTHVRKTATIYSRMERTICAPWGLHDGKAALANRVSIIRRDGTKKSFATGKFNPTELAEGDGFLVETAGGGGFWSALEREPEKVLSDVRSGYVSLDAARSEYGVAITQRGRRFELDVETTAVLRRSLDR
ncbi:MAG: hydantoinase B/oxoprolinase family protein [Deltaproteobacteria bacterium]|nr:hydantoinase B/oxoprolinase family protein [Deltaproteobacteria bacterium]